jgi:hypothetical protein
VRGQFKGTVAKECMAYGGIIATNIPLTQRHVLGLLWPPPVGRRRRRRRSPPPPTSVAISRSLVGRDPSARAYGCGRHVVSNQPTSQRARQKYCLLPSTRRSSAAVADDLSSKQQFTPATRPTPQLLAIARSTPTTRHRSVDADDDTFDCCCGRRHDGPSATTR